MSLKERIKALFRRLALKYGPSGDFVNQSAHLGWGALFVLAFAIHGHLWWGVVFSLGAGAIKEFVLDFLIGGLVGEAPLKEDIRDFIFFAIGAGIGAIIAAI